MEKASVSSFNLIPYAGLKYIEVFKTDVKKEEEANHLLFMLSQNFPCVDAHFDLEDCDNILRVEGDAAINEQIIALLSEHGYQCIALV